MNGGHFRSLLYLIGGLMVAMIIANSTAASPVITAIWGLAVLLAAALLIRTVGQLWQYKQKITFFEVELKTTQIESGYGEITLSVRPSRAARGLERIDIRFMRNRWCMPPWRWNRPDYCSRITGIRKPTWSGRRHEKIECDALYVPAGVQLKLTPKMDWGTAGMNIELQVKTHARRKTRISFLAELDGDEFYGSARVKVGPLHDGVYVDLLRSPPKFEDNLLEGVSLPMR